MFTDFKEIFDKEKDKKITLNSLNIALENELKDIEIVYATEKQRVVSIEEAVSKVENRLQKLRDEKNSIEEQLKVNKDTQKDLNDRISALDEENNSLNNVNTILNYKILFYFQCIVRYIQTHNLMQLVRNNQYIATIVRMVKII